MRAMTTHIGRLAREATTSSQLVRNRRPTIANAVARPMRSASTSMRRISHPRRRWTRPAAASFGENSERTRACNPASGMRGSSYAIRSSAATCPSIRVSSRTLVRLQSCGRARAVGRPEPKDCPVSPAPLFWGVRRPPGRLVSGTRGYERFVGLGTSGREHGLDHVLQGPGEVLRICLSADVVVPDSGAPKLVYLEAALGQLVPELERARPVPALL